MPESPRRMSTTSTPMRARRHWVTTPMSSIKGAIGHCLGAAGAVEAAVTVLAVKHNIAPPTINYEDADPSCDLDYVPNEARPAEIDVALSNSFGFGGHNAVLLLRSYEED